MCGRKPASGRVRVCQAGAPPGQRPAGRTGRVGRPWLQERVREEQVRRQRALGAVAGRGLLLRVKWEPLGSWGVAEAAVTCTVRGPLWLLG